MTRVSILRSLALFSCAAALSVSARPSLASPRYTLITVLHTNDMHSSVSPRSGEGGLARASTLIKQIRAEMPNVLLLDAGDIIHGEPEEYYSGGQGIIGAMNAAGYDVAASGNHEYDFTLPVFQAVMKSARFPFLAANVHAAGGGQWDQLKPYIIKNVDGVKIAILGLTTLDTITLHWPASIKDIVIEDPVETAKRMVPELQKGADVVIVLSHIGLKVDTALAREVPGIDFIVGGHSHTTIPNWTWAGDTLITQTGSHARNLGRIDFIVRKDQNAAQIVSVNGRDGHSWNELPRAALGLKYPEGPLIPLTSNIAEDPAVMAEYLPFRKSVDDDFSKVIGHTPGPVPGGPGEAPASNLVADAVRWQTGADIALIDAGSVPPVGLKGGDITAGEAFGLIGGYTRQQLIVGRMRGKDLQKALDAEFARKKAIWLATSGAAISCEARGGVPVITGFQVGDQSLDPASEYTVASQSYIMMELMMYAPDTQVISERKETTREAIREYIKARKVIEAPESRRIRLENP